MRLSQNVDLTDEDEMILDAIFADLAIANKQAKGRKPPKTLRTPTQRPTQPSKKPQKPPTKKH